MILIFYNISLYLVFYVYLGINPQQVPEGSDKKKYKREK